MGTAQDRPGSFNWPVRVYYEDTDAGGVVYYANYLRYFERCRSEWMRSLGFGQQAMAERDGVLFVVAATEIQYLRPARLDDALAVDARIAERCGSYVVFEQAARRDDQVLCRARTKVACVDARTLRPARLPAALAAHLAPAADLATAAPERR
jgi:acyl-CoA thioester hydrolase